MRHLLFALMLAFAAVATTSSAPLGTAFAQAGPGTPPQTPMPRPHECERPPAPTV